MSLFINNNSGPIYTDCTVTIHNGQTIVEMPEQDVSQPEDITPVQEEQSEPIESIIFTKKAKKEGKESFILQALQKSIQDRRDKTRAFVEELHTWQKEGYIDAHYNARVMYDELDKLMPLSFGHEVFKKHYNNTRT